MHIHPLDVGYLELPGAANAYLIEGPEGFAMVECGTAVTWPALEAKLEECGVHPTQIEDLFLTHIHLDHAGAAGHLAACGARIWVHPFGHPHLIDPEKLLASSRRVHGAMYERYYGDLWPVPPTQAHAVDDGGIVSAAGLQFRAIETAGHARHHHAWQLDSDGHRHIFVGDVLGIAMPESGFISIPTPPPEFDPAAWKRSLQKLRDAEPTHLWLTHGGLRSESAATARQYIDRVEARLDEERAELRHLAQAVVASGPRESEAHRIALSKAVDDYRAWLHPKAEAAGVTAPHFKAFLGDYFLRMNLQGAVRLASTGA
ncbi:MAG: MBL fold metallo-hydrolase [Planctomycetes bacterium]|nr:MBL fold metallo-hydrolase [Planctomycetota bacterium]